MILTCACGKKLRVPDTATGAARCPACQNRIPIPAAAGDPESPPPPAPPRPRPPTAASRPGPDEPPRRRPRDGAGDAPDRPRRGGGDAAKTSSLLPVILGGCALLAVLGCGGATLGGYFLFVRGKPTETTGTTKTGGPTTTVTPAGNATATPTPAVPQELKGHEDMVHALAFSKDGALLASGSRDKTLRIWDVAGGAERKKLDHPAGFVWSAAWTAEGRVVTTSGDGRGGGGQLSWVDPVTGTFRKSIGVNKGNVRPLAVSPDGRRLAWIKGGPVEVIPAGVDAPPGPPVLFPSYVYDTLHMAFTPDGQKLLMSSNSGGQVWDLDPKTRPRPFKDTVQDTTGVCAAGNGLYAVGTTRGVIGMIDPTTLTLVENVRGLNDRGAQGAFGVVATPDGKYVASAVGDGVRFFDPKTRQEAGRFSPPRGVKFRPTCVAVSPDGTKVAAGGGFTVFDNPRNFSIYVWEVEKMSPPPKE